MSGSSHILELMIQLDLHIADESAEGGMGRIGSFRSTPKRGSDLIGKLEAFIRIEALHERCNLSIFARHKSSHSGYGVAQRVLECLTVRGVHIAGVNAGRPLVDDVHCISEMMTFRFQFRVVQSVHPGKQGSFERVLVTRDRSHQLTGEIGTLCQVIREIQPIHDPIYSQTLIVERTESGCSVFLCQLTRLSKVERSIGLSSPCLH